MPVPHGARCTIRNPIGCAVSIEQKQVLAHHDEAASRIQAWLWGIYGCRAALAIRKNAQKVRADLRRGGVVPVLALALIQTVMNGARYRLVGEYCIALRARCTSRAT